TPPTPLAFGAWLLSVCGALLLSCAVTTLMQSSLFWTVTGLGIVRIVPSFVTLLSGNILPLPLFPDALQLFLRVQPFAGLSDLPSRIFCGALPPSAVFSTLALQWFWTVVFVGMGRAMVSRGLRHVVLAGG
ncbi:MAG: ABC-2 family transporter protein, partial [Clostridia bacterium]